MSLGYAQGPLNVTVAALKISTGAGDTNALVNPALQSTASTDVKISTLAANYTFGDTTVYGTSFSLKAGTTMDDKGTVMGVKHTIGQIVLMASQTKLNSSKTGTSSSEADRKVTGIGADYMLSKRTALYVRNENRNMDTGATVTTAGSATATVGAKTTTTAIGFRHTF
jgi:predicted porin